MTTAMAKRRAAKKEQISVAALGLFLAQGFNGTSMDAITAAAGVSKQTLYAYFPTKADLLVEVLNSAIGQLVLTVPAQPQLDTLEDLREHLIGLASRITSNLLQPQTIALLRLVLGEAFHVPELRRTFRDALPSRALTHVEALLGEADAHGLVKICDPELAARMFIGPVMTYVALDGFLSAEPTPPPDRDRLTALVDAFLAGLEVRRR